jgi:DNA repair exonuclease SbcCD nuclease subunit
LRADALPYTIVHCADVHLETTFPELRGGAQRRAALADALERIVDAALQRKADALTVGGDLYEAERAGPQTARFICEQFARFGGPVFVAPGNHDPYSPSAVLSVADLPPNVRVFSEAAWLAVPLRDDLTLYGFAHTPAEPGRPFAGMRFERSGVRLTLVHGSDEERCPPNKRATAPFTAAEVDASGATLLLTGHYHGGYVVARPNGQPVLAYPGSPEPIKFGERGSHGALAVRVDGTRVSVEPLELARTRLLEIDCDVADAASEPAVLAMVERALAGCGPRDYVRLRLCGQPLAGTRVDRTLIAERFGDALGALDVRDETTAYDYETIAREPTVRGRAVSDLLVVANAGGERADDARRALRYAVAAFEGGEIAP